MKGKGRKIRVNKNEKLRFRQSYKLGKI
jgi:hypothetical protein